MSIEGNPAAPGTGFTVGRVIATAFAVLFSNIIRFVAIILIVGVPVIGFFIGGGILLAGDVSTSMSGFNISFGGAANALQILFTLIGLVLGVLGYLLIVSALIHGTLQHLAGRPVAIFACLSAGLAALPRVALAGLVLIIVGILLGVAAAVVMGMVLSGLSWVGALVVNLVFMLAVLMIFARILVFIPAIMVERAGPVDCFGRSQELTREHRWGLFAILLMITVVNWIAPLSSAALSAVSPGAGGVLDIAFAVFFIALVSVLAGVAYHVLRTAKEGAPVGEVAKVFD